MRLCYLEIIAAGTAAGNNSMRMGGRKEWDMEDFRVAAEVTNRLLLMAPDFQHIPPPPFNPFSGSGT